MIVARGDLHGCPGCGLVKPEEEWDVDVRDLGVRETIYGSAQVNGIGFRCPKCGTTWGHEG